MAKSKKSDQLSLAEPAARVRDLRVLSIQIRNVLGLAERSLDADGRAVLISGPNASGKSSLLQAVQAGLGGGSLAKLARVGAPEDEPPEVVLVLGGGGEEYRVEKRGEETAHVLKRVGDSQAFADVPRPQEFLSQLFDPTLANPVAWLLAKPKDQAILLLEALPLEMDESGLAQVVAEVAGHVRPVPAGLHPLEHLALIRDQLFTARTGVNRDARSKKEAAEQLRRELPAKAPADARAAIAEAEARAGELAAQVAREEEKAAGAEREAVRAAQAARAQEEAQARAELERKLHEAARRFETARQAAAAARQGAEATLQARRAELGTAREALAALRGQGEAAARFRALDEQATGFEGEATAHEAESARLSAALDRLDAFRRGLAKDLPIPGLEVEGAEIRLDGVPLAQVNTSRRVEVAARVATARAERNPLKVLFLDGLEGLDSEHREALLAYLVEEGVQAFAAIVTDGEPAVRYIGAMTETPMP